MKNNFHFCGEKTETKNPRKICGQLVLGDEARDDVMQKNIYVETDKFDIQLQN